MSIHGDEHWMGFSSKHFSEGLSEKQSDGALFPVDGANFDQMERFFQ
jgi:hypothetical protein